MYNKNATGRLAFMDLSGEVINFIIIFFELKVRRELFLTTPFKIKENYCKKLKNIYNIYIVKESQKLRRVIEFENI